MEMLNKRSFWNSCSKKINSRLSRKQEWVIMANRISKVIYTKEKYLRIYAQYVRIQASNKEFYFLKRVMKLSQIGSVKNGIGIVLFKHTQVLFKSHLFVSTQIIFQWKIKPVIIKDKVDHPPMQINQGLYLQQILHNQMQTIIKEGQP